MHAKRAPTLLATLFTVLISLGAAGDIFAQNLFQAYESFPTGSLPEAVAIGDINGDGRNDVAMTTFYDFNPEYDYKLFLFLQDEHGQLGAPLIYSTQGSYTNPPQSLEIADMDGDGFADVVIGNSGASIEVFSQYEAGQFSATTYPTVHSHKIRVGDLNGDALPDVAGIDWGSDEVAVFLQDASGSFNSEVTYLAPHGGYDDLDLGDVNSDGLTDIIVMSGQSFLDNLAIVTQNTAGAFDPVSFYDLGSTVLTRGVTVGDMNGDGRQDVVVSYNNSLGSFLQNTGGTLNTPENLPSLGNPGPIQSADVNADGREDIVILHDGGVNLGVYLQQEDGTLGVEELYEIPYDSFYNPHGLAVDDINGDTLPDIVIANRGGLVVLYNNNTPPNILPVADAGSDQRIKQRTTATLDGSGSTDVDGSIVNYQWIQISGEPVTIQNSDTDIATFTSLKLGKNKSMTLEFKLSVTDDAGATTSDTVTITVVKKL